MKPEQKKVIAEGMGYEVSIKPRNIKGHIEDAVFNYIGEVWYDPLTNAEQDREIEIKLLMDTEHMDGKWVATTWNFPLMARGEGDTPAEARCNAAYEYFNRTKP